jgi:hypothetical protein
MRTALAAPLVIAASALTPGLASAATITVGTTNDSGLHSLRAAIAQANTTDEVDTIDFASNLSGSIELQSTLPTITKPLTVQGPGDITLDGSAIGDSILTADMDHVGDTLTLEGLILEDGGALTPSVKGGAIRTDLTHLQVAGTELRGNRAGDGGAVYSEAGAVSLSNVVVRGNAAQAAGGGVAVLGGSALHLDSSTVAANSAARGGGVYSVGTPGDFGWTTVSGNSVAGDGGGLHLDSSSGTDISRQQFYNVTISGNSAGGHGGGMWSYGESSAPPTERQFDAEGVTIAGNSATAGGAGISAGGTAANLSPGLVNSIVGCNATAGHAADLEVLGGPAIGTADDLIQDAPSSTFFDDAGGSDILGKDPQLAPLADSGPAVSTQTRVPAPTSPAIDQGGGGLVDDQRFRDRAVDMPGVPNPVDANHDASDMGAVELQTDDPPQAPAPCDSRSGPPGASTAPPAPAAGTADPPPQGAGRLSLIGRVRAAGAGVRFRVKCAGGRCTGRASLTNGRRHVGARGLTLAAGQASAFVVRLNRAGRKLLRRHRRERVRLTLAQGSITVKTARVVVRVKKTRHRRI